MRAQRFGSMALLAMGFCAAGPPKLGTEVHGGAGAGKYDFASGGCDHPRYVHQVRDVPVHAVATHRRANGLTVAVEGAASIGQVRTATFDEADPNTAPPEFRAGDGRHLGYLATRVGYTGAWAGVSVGPALVFETHHAARPFGSGDLWVGVPRLVYAWGELLAGPFGGARQPLAAGLGHREDRVRVEVGIGPAQSPRRDEDNVASFSLAFDLMVAQRLSLGAFTAFTERDASMGLLRLGWWAAP